jgi:hypothetical protein
LVAPYNPLARFSRTVAAMPIDERWLLPKQPATQRPSAKIVAKGSAKNTTDIVALSDGSYLVAHHEGFAASPGGLAHRNADGSIRASRTDAFGPIHSARSPWIASGPLYEGEHASLCTIDPEALDTRELLPLTRPFCWLSDTALLAHTPTPNGAFDKKTFAYTRLPGYRADPSLLSQCRLPETPGLVQFDLVSREARLLIEASPHDGFRHAVLSADQRVLFAATSYGRVIAVRREDATVLWERPPVRNIAQLSLLAFALSPDGSKLVCAGSGAPHDCLVLDAATGAVRHEYALRSAVDAARVTSKQASSLRALAFHRDGHFAVGTSSGAIILARRDGRISAFKAASCPVTALAFSRDGSELVSGGHEACLRVWAFEA